MLKKIYDSPDVSVNEDGFLTLGNRTTSIEALNFLYNHVHVTLIPRYRLYQKNFETPWFQIIRKMLSGVFWIFQQLSFLSNSHGLHSWLNVGGIGCFVPSFCWVLLLDIMLSSYLIHYVWIRISSKASFEIRFLSPTETCISGLGSSLQNWAIVGERKRVSLYQPQFGRWYLFRKHKSCLYRVVSPLSLLLYAQLSLKLQPATRVICLYRCNFNLIFYPSSNL